MTLGMADVSGTSDSTMADYNENTLGTGTNNLEKDTATHTNLYSGQVEGLL